MKVAKFPSTSGRSGTSPILFLSVGAAIEYQIWLQPPRSVWSHLSRFSAHSRAPIHSPAGSQDAGEPGGGEQVGGLSINVSPKMEQTEKSDNLEQLLHYSACWGAGGTLLKAFENKSTSSLQGLGDSLACVKSLFDNTMASEENRLKRCSAQRYTEGNNKGKWNPGNQSIHTVAEQSRGSVFARIQRLGKC